METTLARKPDPSDVPGQELASIVPYLTVMTPEAPPRHHGLGEVYNALRWIVRGDAVTITFGDQRDTGATAHGIRLEVVTLPAAKRDAVLLPRRWIIARSIAWASRFRRVASDYERLPRTGEGLHFVAFACLMVHLITLISHSP